jgi:hypothetical protein
MCGLYKLVKDVIVVTIIKFHLNLHNLLAAYLYAPVSLVSLDSISGRE